MKKPMNRRKVLRGAGGIALGLPFLEAMTPLTAVAQTSAPKRYVFCYGGDFAVQVGNSTPSSTGTLTQMPPAWASLDKIKDKVSIVGNMYIPSEASPGGRARSNHYWGQSPILSGMRSASRTVWNRATSIDLLVADQISKGMAIPHVQTRVQAASYNQGRGATTFTKNQVFQPIFQPEALFSHMFTGFNPGNQNNNSNQPSQPVSDVILRKKSLLDSVLSAQKRLIADVAPQDRVVLDQFYTEFRAFETKLAKIINDLNNGGGGSVQVNCQVPGKPGTFPINTSNEWSDETKRGELIAEIISLGLICDITRVASVMITFEQTKLRSDYINNGLSRGLSIHDATHNNSVNRQKTSNITECCNLNANWHANIFGQIVERLGNAQEGVGTVLDNSFVSMIYGEGSRYHSSDFMTFAYAGSKDKLRSGVYIDANRQHPAQFMMSGANGIGVPITQMTEVSGVLSEMMV